MADMFDQLADQIQGTPAPDAFDKIADQVTAKPESFDLLKHLARPGAAVRNMLLNDPANLDKSFMEGWNNPDAVGSMQEQYVPALNPSAPNWVNEAGTWGQAVLGSAENIAVDPLTWGGVPGAGIAGKAIGQGLVRAAEQNIPVLGTTAKIAGNQLRSFAPKFAERVSYKGLNESALRRLGAAPSNDLAKYNQWLEKAAPFSDRAPAPNPFQDVPLHPAPEARAAIDNIEYGQNVTPNGFKNILEAGGQAPKEAPAPVQWGVAGDKLKPQGQELLDFSQQAPWAREPVREAISPTNPIEKAAGAEESIVERIAREQREMAARVRAQELAEGKKITAQAPKRAPIATPAATKGVEEVSPEFRVEPKDTNLLNAQDAALKEALKVENNPKYYENADPNLKSLIEDLSDEQDVAKYKGDTAGIESAKARLARLIDDEGNILPNAAEQANDIIKNSPPSPTAWDDLQKILRAKLKENRGSTGGGDISPEVQAAYERLAGQHADKLAEYLKTPGASAAKYVAKNLPNLNSYDRKVVSRLLTLSRPKVGNMYTDVMSKDLAKAAAANPELTTRPVVKDSAVLAKVGSGEAEKELQRTASGNVEAKAAAVKHAGEMAEMQMKLAKNEGDPSAAARYMENTLEYLRAWSLARREAGLVLRHAGQRGMSESFLDELEAALHRGEFAGEAEHLVADVVAKGRKLHPSLLQKANQGIQEYGINMMLYNTDTGMRNVIGGAIGTLLNPIERAANAATTAGLRALRVPEHKIQNPTEFEEVLPSIVAGAKAVPGAIRSGIKFFRHETPQGIAESYAKQAKKFRRELPRAEAKTKIAELQTKKRSLQETFKIQDDASSLGISQRRALASDNPILDRMGRVVNAASQSLKAVDLTNSQIIKEMETTAAIVRKQVQAKRAGLSGKQTLTQADKRDIYDRVLHYTMRQRLPNGVSSLYKGLNKNAVTGLMFPFMRAQITLPRFAVNRSPLAAPSIMLNVGKAVLGKESVDSMQITKAALGTAAMFMGWKKLKDEGVEIHGAAWTPEDRAMRKAAKIPSGIYLKFKDGTVKKADDLAPVSYVLAVYAAIDDGYRRLAEGQPLPDNWKQTVMEALGNMGQGSVFTGLRDIAQAGADSASEWGNGSRSTFPGMNEGERLDQGPGSRFWNRKLVSVTVPRITSEAQRKGWLGGEDKAFRSPRDLGEEYRVAIGLGLQKSVPEQLTAFGTKAERGENMDPLREIFGKGAQPEQDPAIKLFDKLGWYPSAPAKTIDGLRVTQDKRMEQLKKVGPHVHKIAISMANNPAFLRLPERQQKDLLKEMVSEVMSVGSEITKVKMIKQTQKMSPEQKSALKYNLKDRGTDVVAGWGLKP